MPSAVPLPTPPLARHPSRHLGSRWPARCAAALIAIIALIASPGTAAAIPTDPDTDDVACLAGTTATMTSSGSTFGPGGATITWNAVRGCPDVVIRFNGQPVGATGTRSVDPGVTSKYSLIGSIGVTTKILGTRTIIAGKVIGYSATLAPLTDIGPAAAPTATSTKRIFDALSEPARELLVGKVIESHTIPHNIQVTDLPLWQHLRGKHTHDGRPYESSRGGGGQLAPGSSTRIVQYVGEEEMVSTPRTNTFAFGFVLVHETGHTVLDHATTTTFRSSVNQLRLQRINDQQDKWIGHDDTYVQSTAGEYWAEGTAALFDQPIGQTTSDFEYTYSYLSTFDRPLYDKLISVYSKRFA